MEDRRNILKLVGVSSIWTTPVIQSVILPAHATMSQTFNLTVEATNSADDACGSFGEDVMITGTVESSNGSNLEGVQVNIRYTDDPVLEAFADIVVTVQADNTYSYSGLVVPDEGAFNFFPYQVEVTFVDQASYGMSSVVTTGACSNANISTEEEQLGENPTISEFQENNYNN